MKKHCFTLDLINDSALIKDYKEHHKKVWPQIESSIKSAGITSLEIYLVENRLFMIMEVNDNFSFEKKKQMDLENPKVQEWEQLMWTYQQAMPSAKKGEKWMLLEKIYDLA